MPRLFTCAIAAVGVLVLPAAPAHADPLPEFCGPSSVVDDVCTARLASVTADVVNGTITGTPVGGGAVVTLSGAEDAYLQSTGFGDARPDAVQQWDTAIEQTRDLSVDPSDPNWYGNAKAKVFLSRTLNEMATRFPPDTLTVRFTPDDAQSGSFRLVSIQPTAQ
ncbi:hypothetical protein [Mycolicibacterium arenosum]|uniref:Uncharacterized protein n=1 Tax=Mycolicibacterium arenosum TaxID=2952157 RepID=A0ABT1MEQ0_9MYCO|nr:hypothetical protein [Mycolicibacterium sp. CAU 1645]MCP9276689.1 hypothetical protein [Mycolicibacterium sp. CAU 1645]